MAAGGALMYKIFCDETWTASHSNVKEQYYVFYGILIQEAQESRLLEEIDCYKRQRGLYIDGNAVEMKWKKADKEWKTARKNSRKSRYEEFLDIFFRALRSKELSFGIMYLKKSEYERVKAVFIEERNETSHDYFFMLCFHFLYFCFFRNQVKESPCQILIDNRNLGADCKRYDLDKLKKILNKRIYREVVPRNQLVFSPLVRRNITDSIQVVNLGESKQEPLIQLADLCAGCVRYILEHELPPPSIQGQLSLFFDDKKHTDTKINLGKEELAKTFYRKLRSIKGYHDIDLFKISYHHRFCIFPFQFSK